MIGNNIKEFRKKIGLTQKDLANKAGLTRESIGNYERGDRTPNINTLIKISNALDVAIVDIIGIDKCIGITQATKEEKELLAEFNNLSSEDLLYSKSENEKRNSLKSKRDYIIYDMGTIRGMLRSENYAGEDIEKVLDRIYRLYTKRTSLDILKEFIESLNCDYDVKNIDDDTMNDILKKVSDVIELEFYKLNK